MIEYLDRSLITSPYYIGLCTTKKEFDKELKRLKIKTSVPFLANNHCTATCHTFEKSRRYGRIALVTIESRGLTKEEVYSVLVHEAVHIWQEIRLYMSESSPSVEFEAYCIQAISHKLMEAYKRNGKKK